MNWTKEHTFFSGGLIAIGFASDSNALFAITHSGRGIFDLQRKERIARDYEAYGSWYLRTEIEGFANYSKERIPVFGVDSPTPKSVMKEIEDFEVDDQITEFRGASISPDGEYLAVGFSDAIDIYKREAQPDSPHNYGETSTLGK